jgi:hypothetical protein
MTDLDTLIDKEHANAQRAEDDARAIIARLHNVPGISGWLATAQKQRRAGEEPNPWRQPNLSAQALIQRHDPALASFLASRAGQALHAPDYDRQEAERKRAESLHRMQAETEAMRTRNQNRLRQQTQENLYEMKPSYGFPPGAYRGRITRMPAATEAELRRRG